MCDLIATRVTVPVSVCACSSTSVEPLTCRSCVILQIARVVRIASAAKLLQLTVTLRATACT
jgi:hypothetical protein